MRPSQTEGPFAAFLQDIRGLGVRPVGRSDPGCDYAIVAARSNPRWWLLPLSHRRATAAGLAMLQPMTRSAALVKSGLSALAQSGTARLFWRHRIRLGGFLDLPGAPGGMTPSHAYFTGTDGPHRKTSVQIADAKGRIAGYAKITRATGIRPYLQNEKEMLSRVARLGLRTASVPQVLGYAETDEYGVLVTDTLKEQGFATPVHPGPRHLAFLSELAAKTRRIDDGTLANLLGGYLERLIGKVPDEWTGRLQAGSDKLAALKDPLPLCLTHGDFTPTNSFVLKGGLYVFDWEYAAPAGPEGYDLAHFLLAQPDGTACTEKAETAAAALAAHCFAGDIARGRMALLAYLLLHAGFYLERAVLAGQTAADWVDARARAAMIDTLIAARPR